MQEQLPSGNPAATKVNKVVAVRNLPLVLICSAWIVGCLLFFFQQQVYGTELTRLDVLGTLLDSVLGLESVAEEQGESGIQFLSQRVPHFWRSAALLVLAMSLGISVAGPCLSGLSLLRREWILFCGSSGLSLLSLLTLMLGQAGEMRSALLFAPLLISLPCSVIQLQRHWQRLLSSAVKPDQHVSSLLRIVVRLVTFGMICWLLLGAVSPPTDFDVREYHLQGPKEWLQAGRISYLPHNVYTSFPFLSEMLSLAGMITAGDWYEGALTGKLLLACFQILSLLAVASIASRWLGTRAALIAGLIFLTTPWTLRISLIAYAEGALSCYLTTALLLSMILLERLQSQRSAAAWLVVGLLLGSAMASKYTGLLQVIVPVGILCSVVWLLRLREAGDDEECRERQRQLIRSISLCSCGILLTMGPWLIRNLIDTGNPVYPMAYGVFGGEEWNSALEQRWQKAHGAPEHELFRVPQHVLDVFVRNTWVSPLLLVFGIPGLLCCRRVRILPWLAGTAAWGFLMWWLLTHRIDRFWVPMIPLLSVIAAAGHEYVVAAGGRLAAAVGLIIGSVWNIYFCTLALVGFHPGLMDLQAARQLAARQDLQQLNEILPEDALVLLVGEAEVFDAEFRLQYNTVFDDSLFEKWFCIPPERPDESQRPLAASEEIAARLEHSGITHVLVNWGEILRYRIPGSYGYTVTVQPAVFAELQRRELLGEPQLLMRSDLQNLSPMELQELSSWEGAAEISAGDIFQRVLIYPVISRSQQTGGER